MYKDQHVMVKFLSYYYIMAGSAFVVAKGVFIMEAVVLWHFDNG